MNSLFGPFSFYYKGNSYGEGIVDGIDFNAIFSDLIPKGDKRVVYHFHDGLEIGHHILSSEVRRRHGSRRTGKTQAMSGRVTP